MAIISTKDTLKLKITKKSGILLMLLTGAVLFIVIFSNFYWLSNYNIDHVKEYFISKNKIASKINMDSYVRMKVIFSIVGNTLILGFFSGMVWWSISSKRLGVLFGTFWLIVFGGNAISTPFYSVQFDAFAIVLLIFHSILGIIIIFWLANLIAYRQRLRQEIARKKRF